MHPLARKIFESHLTLLPDGLSVSANSHIAEVEYAMIARCIQPSARRAIEIGMAFGVSSLCIADAMAEYGDDWQLTSIDPFQSKDWRGAGSYLLERAGLISGFRLIELPSHLALPQLVSGKEAFDFAFIDGWHTFDHALVDFFFVDLMLEVGGTIVFDDVGFPAIRRVVEFVLSNRRYRLIDRVRFSEQPRPVTRLKRVVKRMGRRLVRTDRDPDRVNEARFRDLDYCDAVAIQKIAADGRSFDHFERF